MIAKLQGVVDYIEDDFIVIMIAQIGYRVFTPYSFNIGENVSLWIETIVREDYIKLFGFKTNSEQDLFNSLISISSIGPKLALSILRSLKLDLFYKAIISQDYKLISSVPGVGKKMAEKILLEFKSKTELFNSRQIIQENANSSNYSELLSALEALGYKRIEITTLVDEIISANSNLELEKLIPIALKKISESK